jgi:hypothetical protein
MNRPVRKRRRFRGFLLLEVVLALAVFAAAGVSFAVIFRQMAQAAALTQAELRITRILDSALDETLSLPVLEEGTLEDTVGDSDIQMVTTIEILDEMETEEGQMLQEMFLITVTARWYEMGEWKERSAETWRYGRMYQP